MSALGRPAVLASVLAAAAVAIHPALGLSGRGLAHAVPAALLLLAAVGLVARAASARERRASAWSLATGAALVVSALAADGVLGHHGALTVTPGRLQAYLDETATDGRPLGLRPLGFSVGAQEVPAARDATGPRVALLWPGRSVPVELTPQRSVVFGGYRFARPAASPTGGLARLRLAASDGSATAVADVSPGVPGRVFGLEVTLEEYFPDFALDETRRPFSRSPEPRNPAALLAVEKGGEAHRVFVLQSIPGIHRVESLGLAFSMLAVEPERAVTIEVHREPAALVALAGALLAAAGVALLLRGGRSGAGNHDASVPLAGAVLVALLLLAGHGAVLAWSFAVPGPGGRVLLTGVGPLLGVGLLAGLAGTLLLVGGRLAGDVRSVAPVGRGILWLAATATLAALLLSVVRVVGSPAAGPAVLPLTALAAAVAWLATLLLAPRGEALLARIAPRALPGAVLAAIAIAIAVSVSGVLRDGTYATSRAAAGAAAALLGLSALEPTRAPGLRRCAFVVALLAPALA